MMPVSLILGVADLFTKSAEENFSPEKTYELLKCSHVSNHLSAMVQDPCMLVGLWVTIDSQKS